VELNESSFILRSPDWGTEGKLDRMVRSEINKDLLFLRNKFEILNNFGLKVYLRGV
jgi:hypothetical protein